ncbi:hypothetical protein KIN20_007903 [Parelaphostrongylus tenuis]|uniref:Uncharacterized protein n=1 Tax=Parelaphostrongylus tenuis TaxID=148309 RepID=A0AAD5M405_PARTN|nr:hypothetical protein KIN20_007903 [Parelaphostrongylus tenuis]
MMESPFYCFLAWVGVEPPSHSYEGCVLLLHYRCHRYSTFLRYEGLVLGSRVALHKLLDLKDKSTSCGKVVRCCRGMSIISI